MIKTRCDITVDKKRPIHVPLTLLRERFATADMTKRIWYSAV